jgi:hypothetical protein
MRWRLIVVAAVFDAVAGCSERTGALTAAQERRLEAEGLVRQADDLMFRYTHDVGRRESGWEDRWASILVTRQSVVIHKNEKLGLEIDPRTRRNVPVRRDGNRVRISAGSGSAAESWSFGPPEDPAGWARDIRTVLSGESSGASREEAR